MEQRGQGRYDRSRYGTGAGSDRPSRRYRDTFYEDMLISDDELERSFAVHSQENQQDAGDGDAGEDASAETSPGELEDAAEKAEESTSQDAADVSVGEVETGADETFDAVDADDAGDAGGDGRLDGAERVSQAYSRRSVENRVAESASKKQRAPKRKLGIVARVAAIVLGAVALVGVGVAFAFVSGITGNLHAGVDDNLRGVLVKTDMANEPFYMLLLGTDGSAERDADPTYGGGYRSDSMMLARIDPVQKKATLISISRDIMVDLGPEYGQQKINAAYAFGGPALAVQAVSNLAGVPISHYAQVDFDGFAAMVDALGGVEVDVPMAIENDVDAGGSVPGGLQTLDGAQALILCRARNSYAYLAARPDEMRAANQRLVLSAIARKLLNSDIATIASMVQAMSAYVTTDLELTDIIGLAQIMKGLNPDTDIYTGSVPTTSKYIDELWYEFVVEDEWRAMMRRVDAGEPPVEEAIVDEATGTVLATAGAGTTSTAEKKAIISVKNGTEITGLAAELTTKLNENGFVNASVGDIAEAFDYPETLVIYDEPGRAREAAEIVSVMGQGRAMQNDGTYLLVGADFIVVIGEDWKQ